jgi:hypothetical protein
MGRREFGRLVEQHMREQGISQGRLATRLIRQLPDEHYFDAAAVGRIISGKRQIDDELFDCLVDILGMDRAEAYYALGVWPTDLSLADYRQLRERVGARPVSRAAAYRRRSDRPVRAQGKRTKDQPSLWAGHRPALTIIAGERAA